MPVRLRTACTIALACGVLIMTGLLSGCSRPDQNQKPTPPPVVVVPKPTERVEMMPSNSDEYLRRHVVDANGIEIETRIEYRNGDKATIKLRPDQTQSEYLRVTKTGQVRTEQHFAADGKTVVSGQELRDDNTMKLKISQDANGTITSVTYWYDGTRVFAEKIQQSSGSYQTTFFFKNGQVWMKRSGPSAGIVAKEQQYTRTGTLEFTREKTSQDVTITYYRADGTVNYRQHLVEVPSQYGNYSWKTMGSIEEFAADGKTVTRKLVMSSDGYSVEKVIRYNSDGTSVVRDVRYDGTVTHEEKRDASGTVTSQKDFSSSDGVREQIDRSITREPYSQDPAQTWDTQERYPQYRNQD